MKEKKLELSGHPKACKQCWEYFRSKRSDAKYCSRACQQKSYKKRLKKKGRIQSLLSFFGLNSAPDSTKNKKDIKQKVDYARLTFILSVLGFLGSLGFYFGVLRELYSPVKDKQKIEQLIIENQELKESLFILTHELGK